jgi:hypothetical protein
MIKATWMHVKVNLRPYCENEDKCVINGLKGSVLAGFDEDPILIVKCCVQFIAIPLDCVLHLSF